MAEVGPDGRADGRPARPHRRRARARRAVRAAARRRPAVRARRLRHEGRAGGDAARRSPTCATRTACGCGSGSSPTRSPRRRSSAARDLLVDGAASSATSRSPASRPTCTSASQAKGVLAMRLEVDGRAAHGATPWLGDNAILQGDRRVPRHRVATVCAAQLGAVRPALDQPRPDPRRRRAEQGARPLRDRRRHPLPARAGSRRRSWSRSRRCPDATRSRTFRRPPAMVDRDSPFVRALCAGGRAAPRRRA